MSQDDDEQQLNQQINIQFSLEKSPKFPRLHLQLRSNVEGYAWKYSREESFREESFREESLSAVEQSYHLVPSLASAPSSAALILQLSIEMPTSSSSTSTPATPSAAAPPAQSSPAAPPGSLPQPPALKVQIPLERSSSPTLTIRLAPTTRLAPPLPPPPPPPASLVPSRRRSCAGLKWLRQFLRITGRKWRQFLPIIEGCGYLALSFGVLMFMAGLETALTNPMVFLISREKGVKPTCKE